jgi:DedD protein
VLTIPAVPAAAVPRVAEDSARAKALLEDKPVAGANAPTELRLVVQVGAFADAAKAREVRLKLEKAGLKTYTQVADSKEGKRTRVRVGPFASKAEADQAAIKIKALDLPATILSL